MARPQSVPAYRRRILRGREVAILSLYDPVARIRRDFTLGTYGSTESRKTYARLIAEWEARGRQLSPVLCKPGGPRVGLSVAQLAAAFTRHNLSSYSPGERGSFTAALSILVGLHGDLGAESYGPNALRAVRQSMATGDANLKPARAPWCRSHCNKQTSRLRSVFKWGVAHELIPSSVYEGLRALEPLKFGRTNAPESEPIKPVAAATVDATLKHLQPPTRAMVELQRLTGMRPGEVVAMRAVDIDMTGQVWTYSPPHHKTSHHGHDRIVPLGPQAQEIVRPFLSTQVDAYLFRPGDAMESMRAARHAKRVTAAGQGNEIGSNRVESPKRLPGDRYTVASYRRAITRAAAAAGIADWHPHQLRHLYATEVRRRHGIEAARVALGHRHVDVTEIYAERDQELNRRIAAEIG